MNSQLANRREIRVRPIIRYIVTDYDQRRSSALGEFPSVATANLVATAVAHRASALDNLPIDVELCRPLRIEAIRGPEQPRPAVRYELREEA